MNPYAHVAPASAFKPKRVWSAYATRMRRKRHAAWRKRKHAANRAAGYTVHGKKPKVRKGNNGIRPIYE